MLHVGVLPVVTDYSHTDQGTAADRHGDEEGQPMSTVKATWKHSSQSGKS